MFIGDVGIGSSQSSKMLPATVYGSGLGMSSVCKMFEMSPGWVSQLLPSVEVTKRKNI
jgi:hypothetical protein